MSNNSLVRSKDYGTRVQSLHTLSNVHSIEGLDKRLPAETTPTMKSTKQHPAFYIAQNSKVDDPTVSVPYVAQAFTLEPESQSMLTKTA